MSIVLPSFSDTVCKVGCNGKDDCLHYQSPFPGVTSTKEFRGPSGCGRDGDLIDIDCSHQRGQKAWGQEQVPLQTGDLMGTVKKQIY